MKSLKHNLSYTEEIFEKFSNKTANDMENFFEILSLKFYQTRNKFNWFLNSCLVEYFRDFINFAYGTEY